MFENFVFGTQAQTANACTLDDDLAASPIDCSVSSPITTQPSTCSSSNPSGRMNDIAHQLSQQSLRLDEYELPQQSIWRNDDLPHPDFDEDPMEEFTTEELTYTSTVRGKVFITDHPTQSLLNLSSTSQSRGAVACRRLQRQSHVQLQSCNNHRKDISNLVEDLLANESQCRLHRPTPSRSNLYSSPEDEDVFNIPDLESRPLNPDEDEGFAEMNDDELLALDEEMSLRRASTPSGIRKYNVVRWRKSADCVSAFNTQGKGKVRSVPRMRRRPKIPSDVRPGTV